MTSPLTNVRWGSITDGLVAMANLVGSAIGLATTPLLDADLQLADNVISAGEKADDLQRDRENRAIAVPARQRPVAADVRIVVTSLRMSAVLECCGALAQHVTKLMRRRHSMVGEPLAGAADQRVYPGRQ